jgi:truncated hemoglobin YjbI
VARFPFRRRRGGIELALHQAEAELLGGLCRELSGLLESGLGSNTDSDQAGRGAEGRVLERLFPRAYLDPTEEDSEAEWQRLVHGDLLDGRRQALAIVEQSLARAAATSGTPRAPRHRGRLAVTLTDEEAEAWLAVLNDARLALGTRLEMTEEFDVSGLDPSDAGTAPYAIYWWLGLLEENLVEVLAG